MHIPEMYRLLRWVQQRGLVAKADLGIPIQQPDPQNVAITAPTTLISPPPGPTKMNFPKNVTYAVIQPIQWSI